MTQAEAFAITHAIAGVMRALMASDGSAPPQKEVEAALVKLMAGFAP